MPFAAAAPMIVLGLATALYLSGVDAALPWAVQDAANSNIYFASFAVALGINVLAVVEGVLRYRTLSHAAQRRVRLAVYTLVPGILAFVVKAGIPIGALLTGRRAPELPWWIAAFLQVLILLPAFGATYAVAVHQVLGPRMVLRRSLQYAFARRTLGIAAAIPFTALTVSLVQARDRTLSEIVRGAPLFYLTLIAFCLAALKYRDRARAWLDQRFFREEYDARKILLSLASRVRFETDPGELSTLVVNQIDEALHPRMVAILASGIEEGRLTPIAVSRRGTIDPLSLEGGVVSMLRWSPEPLDVFFEDPRSSVRRLPPDEQAWLQKSGIALLVPILGEDRGLVAVIALGGRRSEEPYASEDRELIASIASQVGLALDVARLRRRMVESGGAATGARTTKIVEAPAAMRECPQCGRCEDGDGPELCPADGTTLVRVSGIPRVIDRKFRLDQRIGRGGMGSVYRARDVRLERDVAIKVVRAELLGDPDARHRFRREAQLVARLQHPSIVSIFDYGTFPDGAAYLVMELVRGEDLRRLLTREGAPAAGARGAHHFPDLRGDRCRAPRGHPAPRPEAREHPAERWRHRHQGARLRCREARRRRPAPRRRCAGRDAHRRRHHRRYPGVHGAGAASRRAARRAQRRLQPWRDGVRDVERRSAVRSRPPRRHRPSAGARRSAASNGRTLPGDPPRARAGGAGGARHGCLHAAAVAVGLRVARSERGRRRRVAAALFKRASTVDTSMASRLRDGRKEIGVSLRVVLFSPRMTGQPGPAMPSCSRPRDTTSSKLPPVSSCWTGFENASPTPW